MAGKFEPKVPVVLNPPKDDPIEKEYLAKCNGKDSTPLFWSNCRGIRRHQRLSKLCSNQGTASTIQQRKSNLISRRARFLMSLEKMPIFQVVLITVGRHFFGHLTCGA
jgi:hypothetical protein